MRLLISLVLIAGAWAQAHATCYDTTPCVQIPLPDPNPGPSGIWDNKYWCKPTTTPLIVTCKIDAAESPNKVATYPQYTPGKVYADITKCGGTYIFYQARRVGMKTEPAHYDPVLVPPEDLLGNPIPGAAPIPKPCGYYIQSVSCTYM